jgi:outer membrane immunogenic protein
MRGYTPRLLALAALAASAPARAEDVLPTFARDPAAATDAASPWAGLYAGTEIFASTGGRGSRGHVGGGGFIGYNKEFDSKLVLGVEAGAGFSPAPFQRGSWGGYDYAKTSVKVGYDMGRWMPFVAAGAGVAKSNAYSGAFSSTGESVNDLFGPGGKARTFTSLGAGVDYKLTDKVTVGVSVSATQGRGLAPP